MEEIDKKVDEAIEEIIMALPKNILNFFKYINLKIAKFNLSGFYFHHLHGCVSRKCPNIVQLNYFNIKELSKDAIKSVIVHEMGHSYIIYKKDIISNVITTFLSEYQKKDFEEKRADQLVKKWGFKKELKAFKKEAVFKKVTLKNDGTINSYEESKKINEDEKRVDIHLKCEKCKVDYKIEYHYMDFVFQTKIYLMRKEHSKAEVDFEYPIHYKKIMEDFECMDCGNILKVDNIIKNPT